jgi:hypothetical protein
MSLTDATGSRLVDHTISFSNAINLHLGKIGGRQVCVLVAILIQTSQCTQYKKHESVI